MHRVFWAKPVLVGALLAAAVLPVWAAEITSLAGHTVEIKERDSEKSLVVDGRELHRNQFILLDEAYAFGQTLVVVGSSSAGGNACDSAPFVLSFPQGGAARLDGPLDSCTSVTHEVQGSTLLFSTGNIPGQQRERWQWSAEGGITSLAAAPFEADKSVGWASLRERKFGHPADAFKSAEIAESVRQLMHADFDHFQALMTGVGSGQFKGDDFVGSACRPHACLDEAGMIFLSSPDRQVYAAWKPEGRKIVVYPSPVKNWPEKAKAELRNWAGQWP
jgi:hypothetical protein